MIILRKSHLKALSLRDLEINRLKQQISDNKSLCEIGEQFMKAHEQGYFMVGSEYLPKDKNCVIFHEEIKRRKFSKEKS